MCTIFKENTSILLYLVPMIAVNCIGSTQKSGMEGKSILGTKGYNGFFALPLASVSYPSV